MTDHGQTNDHASNSLNDIIARASQYRTLAIHKDNAHYAMFIALQRRNQILGVPVIVLSAIVSTAIFSSLAADSATGWKVATGLISVVAAVLAALQTFFHYAEQAAQHQAAARGYSRLRRRLEQFVLEHAGQEADRQAALKDFGEIIKEMGELEELEPAIGERVYKKIRDRYPVEVL